MVKIEIKGEARACRVDMSGKKQWLRVDTLKLFDGIKCSEDFINHFDEFDGTFYDALLSGYMEFRYEDDKLYTITKFVSNRTLTYEELHRLIECAQGQWSDGIGDKFEKNPCLVKDGYNYYIYPWFNGQKAKATQIGLNLNVGNV